MDPDRSRKWPDLPLKIRVLLAVSSWAGKISRRSDGTINRRLTSLFDPKAPPSKKPIDGVTSSDVTFDVSRKLWLRVFDPTSAAPDYPTLPLVVYFHGGGFAYSAANSKHFNQLCRRIAKQVPAVVISVNYRLAPEHRYPAQYEDGLNALKFIDDGQNAAILPPNTDLSRCFISGDSAGGNIAHHVIVKANQHTFSNLKISGLILLMPFFGGEKRTESDIRLDGAPLVSIELGDWLWKMFLPEGSDRDHEAANVMGPRGADITGVQFPMTMVVMGGYDMLQDAQRSYCEWLKRSGKEVQAVEYPNAFHGFYAFPELPEFSLLMAEIRDFFHKRSSIPH